MKLVANKVSKWFLRAREGSNKFFALNECDFALNEGELTVLYGQSGSGKSTLLNVLSGLLTPSSGNVMAGDTDIHALDDAEVSKFRNEHFGIILQGQSAINTLTVMENVLLPYNLYPQTGKGSKTLKEMEERAVELLKRTGIDGLKDVMPTELSGGELRRMSISRALINDPEFILADEPTSDLDDENTEIVLGMFRELANEGKAVLVITHDKEVFKYADKIFEMKLGIILDKNEKLV
jgi:hypothetical protein